MKILIALAATLCFSLSGFSKTEKTIRVGVSPVMSTAGLFIALEKGYFKNEGLNVEFLTFDSSGAAMTPLLGKGELEVGAGNISSGLLNAVNEGVAIKLVADKGHSPVGQGYMGLIVRTDHIKSGRYKELKDLKGFKVGFTSLGGVSQQVLFEKFLTKAGLQPTDTEYLKLSYPEMNLALEKKELDATIQLEPFISQAESRGFAKKVADASEVYPGQQSGVLIYSAEFASRTKEAKAFMKAYLKGVADYNDAFTATKPRDQKEIAALLDRHLKIQSVELWKAMGPVGLKADGLIDSVLLKNDLQWYLDKKYIKKMPTLETLIDNSFVTGAIKTTGKIN